MKNNILILNSGSSSIKYALFSDLKLIYRNQLDIKNNISEVFFDIEKNTNTQICAVGHRVVHGGNIFTKPTKITPKVIQQLEKLSPLAPLHQPYNIAGIKAVQKKYPKLLQVACFDTAFHHTQSKLDYSYGLPPHLSSLPIQRYGFHGLSYEYITQALPKKLKNKKIIICHLGHGASLCAIKNQRSIATTMGFSTLDGIPMGTRPGGIDPGILLYLLSHEKYKLTELNNLLYKKSGLLGLSGISSDVRDLLKNKKPQAKFALDYFVYRITREIGSLTAALNGLDALVFTAGVGENSPIIRQKICDSLSWLKIKSILVIPTNEELMIAKHTATFI